MNTVIAARLEQLEKVNLASSNVEAAAYDPAFGDLYLWFKTDPTPYRYEKVEESVYRGLLGAASKGHYVWEVIRARGTDSRYAYSKVN